MGQEAASPPRPPSASAPCSKRRSATPDSSAGCRSFNISIWPLGTALSSAGMKSAACVWPTRLGGWPRKCGAVRPELIERCRPELERIDRRIRPGTLRNVGPTIAKLADLDLPQGESPRRTVARLREDIADFRRANNLEHVVVVNVASTEPLVDADRLPSAWAALEATLAEPSCPLPASSLYAIAALDLGCSYINFTPSLGAAPAAIDELARLRGTATPAATARPARRCSRAFWPRCSPGEICR